MGESMIFAIVLVPGTPPLVCEIAKEEWKMWKDSTRRTIKVIRPRSMQAQVNQQRQMEIVIGPVYPMLTKQAELVCSPTVIEFLGDIENGTCADNAQLYRDYKDAAEAWYKEAMAAKAGISLATPGDIPRIGK